MRYTEIDGTMYDVKCCVECPFVFFESFDEMVCNHPTMPQKVCGANGVLEDCPLRTDETGRTVSVHFGFTDGFTVRDLEHLQDILRELCPWLDGDCMVWSSSGLDSEEEAIVNLEALTGALKGYAWSEKPIVYITDGQRERMLRW